MSGVFGYSREAVRVKVQKCGNMVQPEYRKFSVDPQITSFEVLQSIIAKAFDLKGEFTVSYRAIDDYGQETYLSLLSDWDLDAAFLSASDPCLGLQIEPKPFQESADEWDETATTDVDIMPSIRGLEALRLPQLQMQQLQGGGHPHRPASHQSQSHQQSQASALKMQHRLPGLILNQVERTFNMVQRALNLGEESQPTAVSALPPRPPLTDAQFRIFLDPIGQVVQDRELRRVIYYGGIEPSLRKVVWKHILNVYPDGMSGKERMDYMKKKAQEYYSLRDYWKDMMQKNQVTQELTYVTSMVRKDVLRTDRHHPFYAGNDDNQNVASLFNILTTYALNHPTVSYCQGMSDLASPLLVTMGDEAHAYICFCALMCRLSPNFMLDGMAMTLRFQHLGDGLLFYDPEFYAFLKSRQADDLLFCYRWLLLEMKREFAFDDALRMMEVMWSSLPPTPTYSGKELPLYDVQFLAPTSGLTPPPISPLLKSPRENAYTKVCALRRQGSGASLLPRAKTQQSVAVQRQNQSLDETGSIKGKLQKVKVKPFSSLDDSSLLGATSSLTSDTRPDGGIKFDPTEDSNCHRASRSQKSPSEKDASPRSGVRSHLKEKFQSGRCKNLLLSLEKLDRHHDSIKEESQIKKDENARVVKNLNEFLNFSNLKRNNSLSPKKSKTNLGKQERVPSVDDSVFDSNTDFPSLKSCTDEQKTFDSVESASTSTYDRSTSDSSPDDSDYFPMTTSMTQELRNELDGLDRHLFGPNSRQGLLSDDTEDTESACSGSTHLDTESDTSYNHQIEGLRVPQKHGTDDVFLWENPLKASPITPDEQAELEQDSEWLQHHKLTSPNHIQRNPKQHNKTDERNVDLFQTEPSSCRSSFKQASYVNENEGACDPGVMVTSNTNCEEAIDLSNLSSSRPLPTGAHLTRLPPPTVFGGGNPFLMFLCLTILRQHRDFIMHRNYDYNDIAMHFDKMVRKHDVTRVLNQARLMYAAYLKQYNNNNISASNQEKDKESHENVSSAGLKV